MSNLELTDLDFVKFFFVRENYNEYVSYLDKSLLTREPLVIIAALEHFYIKYQEMDTVDVMSFATWFLQFHTTIKDKQEKQVYKELFSLMDSRPTHTQDIILKEMQLRSIGNKLKSLAEGKITSDKLQMLTTELDQVEQKNNEIDELVCKTDYNSLFDEDPFEEGYEWGLDCLNENINKIPTKGFFMCVAARPGACKSSFLLQNVIHIAKQIPEDGHIIWFNNEGSIEEMKRRLAVTICKRDREQIFEARKQKDFNLESYIDEQIGNRHKIVFVELATRGIREAEKVLKYYRKSVKLIIVDMLDNVDNRKQQRHVTNSDALFGLLYQWWLGVACIYAPVIGTSQMNKAADPRFPKMEDLVGSKNLKQGALSCQLMIGHEEGSPFRYLSSPKNKYGKGGTTWASTVIFDEKTNQFRGV